MNFILILKIILTKIKIKYTDGSIISNTLSIDFLQESKKFVILTSLGLALASLNTFSSFLTVENVGIEYCP